MAKTSKFSLVLRLIYAILIILLLFIPKIIVHLLRILESVSRILKNTISFFIEQVQKEALIYNTDKRWEDQSQKVASERKEKS